MCNPAARTCGRVPLFFFFRPVRDGYLPFILVGSLRLGRDVGRETRPRWRRPDLNPDLIGGCESVCVKEDTATRQGEGPPQARYYIGPVQCLLSQCNTPARAGKRANDRSDRWLAGRLSGRGGHSSSRSNNNKQQQEQQQQLTATLTRRNLLYDPSETSFLCFFSD